MTTLSAAELAPCPFCGAELYETKYVRDGRQVRCGCGASGPSAYHGPSGIKDADARAIAAWNRRTEISAALRSTQEGWRPISTAPKDGTEVLLFGAGYLTSDGRRYAKAQHIGWFDDGHWITRDVDLLCDALMWRRLPQPPVKGETR